MANIQKRINSKGEASYKVLVRRKGYPTQTATFKRLTDARDWAKITEAAMRENRFFNNTEAKRHTVAQMIDRYLKMMAKDAPKRYRDVAPMLAWWRKELGHCILADLSKALLSETIDKLSARTIGSGDSERPISPARINRYLSAFSHACRYAVNEWGWLERHPMDTIRRKSEPRGRVRYLNDDERKRFLAICKASGNPHLYPIVVLALSTGARRGEILPLRWHQVDFSRNVIVLHDTKNKERRVLPLAGHAYELMKDMAESRHLATDLVFPSPTDMHKPVNILRAWNVALEKAGLEDFRFHDLRHSCASYLAMNGASSNEIAAVLGHKTLQMVKRYSHLSEAHTTKVVAEMNERIFG